MPTQAHERLLELWFLMHGSDDPKRRVLAYNCYLDDSGSAGETAILGGCVLDKQSFLRLDEQWNRMLSPYALHGIDGLHMKDFVRPHGRHIGIRQEFKLDIFKTAVKIIRRMADYTLSVTVPVSTCEEMFSKDFQKDILGPFGIAFIGVSQLNIRLANTRRQPDKMAYLMDTGNPYATQIHFGHSFQSFMEKVCKSSFTGSLTFENDTTNTAIQAADMIAWAARRSRAEGLTNEYAPLAAIFEGRFNREGLAIGPHYAYRVRPEAIAKLKQTVDQRGATLPTLQELLDVGSRSTVLHVQS